MKIIDYNFDAEITNDLPNIILELSYKDEFSNDKYILRSTKGYNRKSNSISFDVIKEGSAIGQVLFSRDDESVFINEFFDFVDDYDFKKEFEKTQLKQPINEQVNDFLDRYDNIVFPKEITFEGETRRMRKIAGLL